MKPSMRQTLARMAPSAICSRSQIWSKPRKPSATRIGPCFAGSSKLTTSIIAQSRPLLRSISDSANFGRPKFSSKSRRHFPLMPDRQHGGVRFSLMLSPATPANSKAPWKPKSALNATPTAPTGSHSRQNLSLSAVSAILRRSNNPRFVKFPQTYSFLLHVRATLLLDEPRRPSGRAKTDNAERCP